MSSNALKLNCERIEQLRAQRASANRSAVPTDVRERVVREASGEVGRGAWSAGRLVGRPCTLRAARPRAGCLAR